MFVQISFHPSPSPKCKRSASASCRKLTVRFGSVSNQVGSWLQRFGYGAQFRRFRFRWFQFRHKNAKYKIVKNRPVEAVSRLLVSTIEFLAKNYIHSCPQNSLLVSSSSTVEFFGSNVYPKNQFRRFRFRPVPVQRFHWSIRFRRFRFRFESVQSTVSLFGSEASCSCASSSKPRF